MKAQSKIILATALSLLTPTASQAQSVPRGDRCFVAPADGAIPASTPCLPAVNLAQSSPYTVSGVSLSMGSENLHGCVAVEGRDNHGSWDKGGYSTATLICKVREATFRTKVQWTEREFLIRSAQVYVCGPNTNFANSDFDKNVRERYGAPALPKGTPDNIAQYVFVDGWESLEIQLYNANAALADIGNNKVCPADSAMWRFTLTANEGNGMLQRGGQNIKIGGAPQLDDFAQHVKELVRSKANETKHEKF